MLRVDEQILWGVQGQAEMLVNLGRVEAKEVQWESRLDLREEKRHPEGSVSCHLLLGSIASDLSFLGRDRLG